MGAVVCVPQNGAHFRMNTISSSNPAEQSKQREQSPTCSEFQAALKLAGQAFKFAEEYQTPPVPKAYEVWYSYAGGECDQINNRIDAIIENGGAFSSYEIEQICDQLRQAGEADHEHPEATGQKLDKEMDAILSLVRTYLASSESFSGSLNRTAQSLSDAAKPEQVRKTIELLITENDKMRNETAKLNSSLEQTKQQVQELRTNLEKARESGLRDALTNLGNRRRFELVLAKEIAEAHAEKTELCLAIGDLDHFKRVNDTFGHPIGDEVLKFFASLLTKNVKGRDTAARYGGEEFAIILPITKLADAKNLIEQIRSQLETTDLVLSKSQKPLGKVTASFGIAKLRESDDPLSLVERADAKLYEAKHAGRNRVLCDDAG